MRLFPTNPIARNVLFYIFIVIVPTILFSYWTIDYNQTKEKDKALSEAQRYAMFHAMNIDRFIGETKGRLETLIIHPPFETGTISTINRLLLETCKKDARYSGFYWVHPSGDVLLGTNPLPNKVNLKDRNYWQEVIRTRSTQFSDPHIGRVTGRYIISVATPVYSNDQLLGVLIGSVRLDTVEESLKRLNQQEMVQVHDKEGNLLLSTGPVDPSLKGVSFDVQISSVPWILTATLPIPKHPWYSLHYLGYIMTSLVITHILFILAHFIILTRRYELEKVQNEAQKLELVGSLAASTAHEIRNPLTGIKGFIKLLSEKYQDEKDQFYFRVMEQEINRINNIVSELLVLGKPTAEQMKTIDLHEVFDELLPIIESEANLSDVELLVSQTPVAMPLYCSKNHIKQILLNLTKNALESMDSGGQLEISLEKRGMEGIVKVKDSGSGIPDEMIQKIFDPFFTSKYEGTGLGLVVCKRILDMYKGKISVKSSPGYGTTVEFSLPLHIEEKN